MKKLPRHIKFEKLVQRAEGFLPFDELQTVEKHLSECDACALQMRRLDNFFQITAKNNFEKVPQFVTANLLNIYQKPQQKPQRSGPLKRLLGLLVFDDWLPEFAVQERSASLDTRQLLYRAERYEIDLRLNFSAGKCQVSGQIFPDCSGGKINVFSENASVQTDLNEHCEFILPTVEEGVYSLQTETADEIIEIQNLSLIS